MNYYLTINRDSSGPYPELLHDRIPFWSLGSALEYVHTRVVRAAHSYHELRLRAEVYPSGTISHLMLNACEQPKDAVWLGGGKMDVRIESGERAGAEIAEARAEGNHRNDLEQP